VRPVKPMVATDLTDALCFLGKKYVTAGNGSLVYIRSHPGLFKEAGVREKLSTL
jgi:hypothetical protein